ncbi:EF-hand domain-containing protein [Rhizobium leguminosarum]|jgi:Ca2+-binding EF-hand superfamily protein|uniref:EF-hand domain-containing protein n=2 Tax=Rhizobium TaxID=379 RepID=A0A444HRR3_RHILE|nr:MULTISPECIES: EF-hand domain-containing protein [Rhizobium]NKL61278.1 EF-hand domain-containing protein [Rhizobium leguminosarum bv. viciae]RWX25733.1 EF-hand domain-containing protein [Rhizobium leguminosarum]TAU45526.1 EF-hand domain-containing protein [Rhizobium leguminosarum]TBC67300.1 EF-hand domain-containing protein [Rhizobium leguminosarum]TBC89520.1 EF-hand domain-containing protein [Rhizobium leguminosarum]
MTTISAATSISPYSYSKSSTSASQDVLSCNTVSAKKSTTTQQRSEDATNSAEKLMSQLMSLTMNGFADQSASSEQQDGGADMDVAQLDSDGDGYVSKAEFVAARPSDVSEDQAGTLFDSFDSEGSGSLSVDALTEAMSAQQPERADGPPPPPPSDDDDLASPLSDLDTDSDGLVSKAEFVAGRPSDVSEEQAGTLFDSFDSEGSGSLSVDTLTEAMSAQQSERPEGPPPSADDDQFASLLSDLDTDGDGLVTLDEFMAGKPDDATESQASQLFSLLDTSGTGSLSAQSTS